uniref:Metalloendopeptidase n=1 Tax=Romanomermis culicivorax TaxID=13658 RepID=A0A915KQI9_ROMCU
SRTDRDENVKIVWKNIEPDAEDQFEKYGLNTITLLDLPYDYGSVMHYGPKAFSKNDKDTIVPLKSAESSKMGQREGFSSLDVQKLRKLYACDDSNGFGAVVTKS